MSFSPESVPLLSDYLVPKEGSTMGLLLDMKPIGNFSDFVEAVRSCRHHISTVHVHRTFMKDLTDAQKADLLDSLEDLKEIEVSFVTLPVRLLANLLLRSEQLERLCLDRIILVSDPLGSESNHDALFFSALQGLQSLTDFHFSLSAAATAGEGQKLVFQVDDEFDTLFQSLSGIQALEKVYVSIGQNFASRSDIQPGTLRSLLTNSAVQDLSLQHFPLHREHCQAIAEAGSRLKSLSLIKAGLRDEDATILANCLPNMALKTLCLGENKICDLGAASLTRVLSEPKASSSLELLDLHGNQLTSGIGRELSLLLRSHAKLTFLDISSNVQFGDAGVQSMALALGSNTTLTQLNLFSTGLSNEACRAFAAVLRVNTTLKNLNLYHNMGIDAHGIQALAETLEHHNYDLQRLEVSKKRSDGDFGLDFFLRLNREFSRRTMKTQTSEMEYVNGIHQAATRADLSSIFYFLQDRPSLCSRY